MAISSKIDEILASRSAKAKRLKQHKTELAAVRMELIKNQKAIYEQVERIDDPELRKKYEDIVDGIDITDVIGDLDGTCKLYDDGIKRFQRDYISIATIGKEGQGKSRLLQAIGNLSGQIIPSGDAGSCTGATSIVWNDPTLSPGRVRCKITFRQPEALIEVIKPYIQTLDPDYLNDHEIRFEAIGAINVNRLYRSGDQADAFRSSAKEHLEKIVDNFSEIRDLFGDIPRILEDPNEIQTFVAQNDSLPADDPNRKMYDNYLAVERADIHCHFFADVGKIRLVDTVGIGATQFGIEDAMLNTVDKECDAAIVMCKPDNRGVQTSDQDLYTSRSF